MPRFFVNRENIDTESGVIRITDDARHIARSLRMAVGDTVTVCDGSSNEYSCTLIKIRDEECECQIQSVCQSAVESPVDITLCMAYPKGDKLETVIQKSVELGASRIIPFESSRCIKRPKAEKIDMVTERLRRIAEEAAKQCGRARIPEVTHPLSFIQMLDEAVKCELPLLCYENEEGLSIKDAIAGREKPASVAIIVGSEGGFSPEEAAEAMKRGVKSVSLGNRILRCETAPSFALAALSYEFEL